MVRLTPGRPSSSPHGTLLPPCGNRISCSPQNLLGPMLPRSHWEPWASSPGLSPLWQRGRGWEETRRRKTIPWCHMKPGMEGPLPQVSPQRTGSGPPPSQTVHSPKALERVWLSGRPLTAPSSGIPRAPERSSWATRPGEVLLSLSSKPTGLLSAVAPLPMALGLRHAGHPAQVPDPRVERCPVPPEPGRGFLTAERTLLGGWGCGQSSWLPDFTRGGRSGQEKGGRLGAQS